MQNNKVLQSKERQEIGVEDKVNRIEFLGAITIPLALDLATLALGGVQIFTSWRAGVKAQSIADQRQQYDIMSKYLENMKGLLLDEKLFEMKELEDKKKYSSESRKMARAMTLNAARQLEDPRSKGELLKFLYEAELVGRCKSVKVENGRRRQFNCTLPLFPLSDIKLENTKIDSSLITLAGIDLTGANLSGSQLPNVNLSSVKMNGVIFEGANLSGASLTDANIQGAELAGVNLQNAYLNRVKISNSMLQKADLSKARLQEADLRDVDLTGANLTDANLTGAFYNEKNGNSEGTKIPQKYEEYKKKMRLCPADAEDLDKDCAPLINP